MGLNDQVSSVRFLADVNPVNPDSQPESTFNNIHTVLRLYQNSNYSGWYVTVLGTTNTEYQNINDFLTGFGVNDFASSYQALVGPNPSASSGIRLWTDAYWGGTAYDVYGGNSGNIQLI